MLNAALLHTEKYTERSTHELDISSVIEHQVLGLEIPVDDTLGMEVFERFDDAGHTESRRHIVKMAPTHKQQTG